MVLPILIPAATPWPSVGAIQRHPRHRPTDRWTSPPRRRVRPRWHALSSQPSRRALASHWGVVAAHCIPPHLPPLVADARASASCRDLLARCEALLRLLLRHRRRSLALSAGELGRVATSFDGLTLRARAKSAAHAAFVLASMYWCGCRHPMSLLMPPLHPPTGLVRWLAGFAVQDQVKYGQLLFVRLAEEERRIFGFALRLVERMRSMAGHHSRGIALLPELLTLAEPPIGPDSGLITTLTYEESRVRGSIEAPMTGKSG